MLLVLRETGRTRALEKFSLTAKPPPPPPDQTTQAHSRAGRQRLPVKSVENHLFRAAHDARVFGQTFIRKHE